jgi:hypothetical protein
VIKLAPGRAAVVLAGFSATGVGNPPQRAVIRHWTGRTWQQVTLPAKIATALTMDGSIDSRLGAASARSVWFFGGVEGDYLRLHRGRWSLGRLPGGGPNAPLVIHAVKVFSPTNVWAFGERDSITAAQEVATPYAAHYSGRRWARAPLPWLPCLPVTSGPLRVNRLSSASPLRPRPCR